MNRNAARLVLLSALVATVTVSGCSTSGSPQTSGGTSAATGGSSTGRSTSPAPLERSVTDPRRAMPTVTAATLAGVGYRPASGSARARLAPVMKASGGLIVSGSVKTLEVSGDEVGSVGVYDVKAATAKSRTFQDQYVVQLVNAVARTKATPRFVRVDGQVLALSAGSTGVAGWFEGNRLVLVSRTGPTPDLTALALAVKKSGGGR